METTTKEKKKKPESEMTAIELMQDMMKVNEKDDDEIFIKSYLLERVFYSWELPFYDKGRLFFFEEKDKLFGDKVLIAIYSEGEAEGHSEKMGIDVKKHFVVDEYTLLPKSSIKFLEVTQNSCQNPDCKSCVEGEPQPARLDIVTESRTIPLMSFTQSNALDLMVLLNCWKEGGLKQFVETPFEDEDSFKEKK